MARTPSRLIVLFVAALAIGASAFAEENKATFAVAPPPVGYPDFKAGDATEQAGGGAVVIKTGYGGLAGWLVGGSGAWQYQYCPADELALGFSVAGSLMVGDRNSLLMMSAPLGAGIAAELFEWRGSTFYAFGYAGGALNYSSRIIGIPIGIGDVIDETSVETMSGIISAGIGCQANLALGGFVVSPFAQWTWSGGVYGTTQSSSMSFDYPSQSGEVEFSMNSIYGFDLLYKPLGWSLSSQLRFGDGYQMITLALRRLLAAAKARSGA